MSLIQRPPNGIQCIRVGHQPPLRPRRLMLSLPRQGDAYAQHGSQEVGCGEGGCRTDARHHAPRPRAIQIRFCMTNAAVDPRRGQQPERHHGVRSGRSRTAGKNYHQDALCRSPPEVILEMATPSLRKSQRNASRCGSDKGGHRQGDCGKDKGQNPAGFCAPFPTLNRAVVQGVNLRTRTSKPVQEGRRADASPPRKPPCCLQLDGLLDQQVQVAARSHRDPGRTQQKKRRLKTNR